MAPGRSCRSNPSRSDLLARGLSNPEICTRLVISEAVLKPAARLPTATGWRELTTWRRAISGEAASEAARRAGASERRALAELAAAVDAATTDFPAFRRNDSRLHVAFAEIAGNRRLIAAETAIQAELADILAAVPAPAVAARLSSAGHGPILAAVAGSNPAEARTRTHRHCRGASGGPTRPRWIAPTVPRCASAAVPGAARRRSRWLWQRASAPWTCRSAVDLRRAEGDPGSNEPPPRPTLRPPSPPCKEGGSYSRGLNPRCRAGHRI
jgi:hypothetical protein